MKPAVDWHCTKCNAELGIAQQLGKRISDREKYCLKCAKEVKK